MTNHTELIVMLTNHDRTVENAAQIFEQCKDLPVRYWGMKEDGLGLAELKALFAYMKEMGKRTVLEVVAYTQQEGLAGAKMAADCGCDILMGTMYCDAIRDFCKEKGILYMPFVGKVTGRPSVLGGTLEEMLDEARVYLQKGVDGFDLLGYRHPEAPAKLIRDFVAGIDAPVCVAGSVNSYARLEEVKTAAPWAFTIGGAFFDGCFGGDFARQIEKVLSCIKGEAYAETVLSL